MKMKMGQDIGYRVDALARGLALQADAMRRMEEKLAEHQSLIRRAQSQGDSNGGKLARLRESLSEKLRVLSKDLWRVEESLEEKIEDNWRRTAETEDVEDAINSARSYAKRIARLSDARWTLTRCQDQREASEREHKMEKRMMVRLRWCLRRSL